MAIDYIPLVDSPNLDPVAELAVIDGSAVTIAPSSYATWDAMFAANPTSLDYLVTPGDYRSWGDLNIDNMHGVSTRRITIRFHDPSETRDHPVKRSDNWARVGKVCVARNATFSLKSTFVLIHGLTISREPGEDNQTWTIYHGEGIVIDKCLIEGMLGGGIRILDSNNVVQRCVVRDFEKTPGVDNWGIMPSPLGTRAVYGTRILDNEVYNCIDCLAATVAASPGDAFTEVGDTLIEGNDLYNERWYFDALENMTDFKTGSDTQPSYMRNNRIWGYKLGDRAIGGSGSSNKMILMHRGARNWVVEDNIVGEGEDGVAYYESIWQSQDTGDPWTLRNITFQNNRVYDVERAYGPTLDADILNNDAINVKYVFDKGSDSGRGVSVPPDIEGNRTCWFRSIEPPDSVVAAPYDPELNAGGPNLFVYQRRRWTGPELKKVMGCTTFATARDRMVELVEDIVPTMDAKTFYRSALDEFEFEEWAQKNPHAALRRFTIENNHDVTRELVTNADFVDESQTFTIRIAYPKHMRIYGVENRRDMDDYIEADRNAIDNTIGSIACHNWVMGVYDVEKIDSAVTEFEDVRILEMTFEILYRREGI